VQEHPSFSPDRLLRLPDVEALTGLRKSALYQAMKDGRFPPCVKLSARASAWPESEVQAWIASRIRASRRGGK
jgi:prophage regulatory protein